MKTLDFPQGTEEWLAARAGKVTASRVSDVLAKIKTGEAAARRDYRAQIVAEILTGKPQESGFLNAEMQWGTEQEPFARAAYEVSLNAMVDQVGLVLHPRIDRAAASPDGVVGDGLIECKCPKTATHLSYLLAGEVPAQYQPQMLWQMACTDAAWCDFVSFDPRLPEDLQLFVRRLERDEPRIKDMEAEVVVFLAEVDETLKRLKALRG
ncbi:MAG: lambda exonuclease family protein [Sterolibacterium sp.]